MRGLTGGVKGAMFSGIKRYFKFLHNHNHIEDTSTNSDNVDKEFFIRMAKEILHYINELPSENLSGNL